MLDPTKNRYAKDPYDMAGMKKFIMESDFEDKEVRVPSGIHKEMQTSLRRMDETILRHTLEAKAATIVAENNLIDDELFLIEKDLKSDN